MSIMHIGCRLLLAPVAAGLVLSAPLAAGAVDPFEIDAIAPLTGGGAFLGRGWAEMLGVIEGVVNKSGGIAGRPIKFVVHDDATSPQQDVQIINAIIAKKAAIVSGPELVATCGAIEPLIKDNGPVVYCASTGIHPDEGSYMFSCGVSTADTIATSVRYFRERGFKKMAVLTSTDATGQDADKIIDALFAAPENRDAQIVSREHFAPADVSVTAQLTRIRASGAQALVAWTTGTPLGTVLRGASSIGLDIPIVSGPGNLTYAQMKAYAGILPRDIYFPAPPALVPDSLPRGALRQRSLELQTAFRAAGVRPDLANMLGWDSVFLMIEALKKRGTNATAAQVRDFIVSSRFIGVNGNYDFKAHPQRGLDANGVIMVRWEPPKDTWIAVSRPGGKPL